MKTAPLPLETSRARKARGVSFAQREYVFALIAILPALSLYVVFTCYPLLTSLGYAFTDWNGYSKEFHFVGFDNFATIFRDKEARQAFGNTLYLALGGILIGLPLQFVLAVLVTGKLRGRSAARAILYTPSLLSSVIVALMWTMLLQYTGVINEWLRSVGAERLTVDWLGDIHVVKNALLLVNTWQFTGWGMVLLMAGITSIPEEVVEAARLDGAAGWTLFRSVTLPLMMPTITVYLFLSLTGALKIFDLPFILTKGGPRNASTTMVMEIYTNAFGYERFGVASAIGLLFFVFIAIITIIQLVVTRRREVQL